jgi:hypothetical protein
MDGQNSDRKELERRLEQARRMLHAAASDRLTSERLSMLVRELEQQLR